MSSADAAWAAAFRTAEARAAAEAWVAEQVASAPPFTEEQKADLRRILRPRPRRTA